MGMFGFEDHFSRAPRADTGASNDGPAQNIRLEDTDWKFIRFGNEAANDTHGPGDIYLRLRSNGKGMRLFDGCNVIFGRYEVNEQKLRFLIAGVTKWECTRGPEERRQLLKVLQASSRWNILDDSLELYGAGSNLLARFEAQRGK